MKTLRSLPLPHPSLPSGRVWALALILLAGSFAGCEVATSRQPIGRRPAALGDLHLEGVWRTTDGQTFFVRVADAAAARLELASVSTNETGFVLERTEVLLRDENDVLLANIRARDPKPDEDYTFGRLAVNDGALVLTLAPAKAVRRLITDGTISGNVTTNASGGEGDKYSVVVTGGFDRLASTLTAPTGGQYLDLSHPIVLVRQKAGHD